MRSYDGKIGKVCRQPISAFGDCIECCAVSVSAHLRSYNLVASRGITPRAGSLTHVIEAAAPEVTILSHAPAVAPLAASALASVAAARRAAAADSLEGALGCEEWVEGKDGGHEDKDKGEDEDGNEKELEG